MNVPIRAALAATLACTLLTVVPAVVTGLRNP